jgi:uncharacterized protein (UPF0333 family)
MRFHFPHRTRGQAMAEFALLLPVLLLLALGIFEFGRAYYTYSAIANAARESARYGAVSAKDKSKIINAGISAAVGLGLTPANFTVICLDNSDSIDNNCFFDNRIRVTVTYTFTAVAPLIPSFPMKQVATMRLESQ